MKVSQLLEATKGAWKISNLKGVDKTFKSEESPEARAWMSNRGDANQVWNGSEWEVKTPKTKLSSEEKWKRDDDRYAKRRERENGGKHLTQEDYKGIYDVWMNAVGDSFPDGDPIDRISSYLKKNFPEIDAYNTLDVVDRALKKHGRGEEKKGHHAYMTSTWEAHALDVLHDINALVEKGKTLGQAIDAANLGDSFFHTSKGSLAMNDNPWGKPDRKKYKDDWAKRYPKLALAGK